MMVLVRILWNMFAIDLLLPIFKSLSVILRGVYASEPSKILITMYRYDFDVDALLPLDLQKRSSQLRVHRFVK